MYFNFSDTDECKTETHKCSSDATCLNTVGSFNCICIDGFSGDGHNCTGDSVKSHD